ncbi:MAG: rhomboid family intramembrane serine protease [Planctomycetota bacterium]
MFFPFGDEPNPPKAQWITRILLALNVVIHLFVAMPLEGQALTPNDFQDVETRKTLDEMWAATGEYYEREGYSRQEWLGSLNRYDLFVFEYGYKPGKPDFFALIFCMFLHAGFLHLFGNMLYLWIFGDNVEHRLGPVLFPLAYLGTGIAATLSFALLNSGSMTPLVGASGAISGVLGFYLIWFPRNRIKVLIFFFIITVIYVPATFVLIFYLIVDNIFPFLMQRGAGGGGVAHAAHIGGFVAGMVLAFLLRKKRGPVAPAARRDPRDPGPRPKKDPGLFFAGAMEAGRMEDAAHAFAQLAREGGTPPVADHVFRLGNWLYENEFFSDAAAVFRYYIRRFPRGEDLDRVNLGLGTLLARRLGKPVSARQYLLTAIELAGPESGIAERARAELERI